MLENEETYPGFDAVADAEPSAFVYNTVANSTKHTISSQGKTNKQKP